MSMPKLKKGPEDVVRFLEIISPWTPPLSWCSEQGPPDSRMCRHLYISGPMQTDSSLPEPGFIFHTYFTPTHFLHRVHMNPVNPIDSAVVHPPRLLVALWCYRQL